MKKIAPGTISPIEMSKTAPVDRTILQEKFIKIHSIFLGKDQSWESTGEKDNVLLVVAQGAIAAKIDGEEKDLKIGDWVTFLAEQKLNVRAVCDSVLVVVE